MAFFWVFGRPPFHHSGVRPVPSLRYDKQMRMIHPSTDKALQHSALRRPNAKALTFFMDAGRFDKSLSWTYQQ